MSRVVDFDQIRSETELGEPIEVTYQDQTFHVHPEFPWEAAVQWDAGNIDDALAQLVPDDELDGFRAMLFGDKPSRATALGRLLRIWRVEPGESKASSRSSVNGGTRSRPTSKRTTGST